MGRLWGGWKEIAEYIGDFQARVLLTVFYWTLVVPFGILVRLTGDPLHLSNQPATSGWTKRERENNGWPPAQRQF